MDNAPPTSSQEDLLRLRSEGKVTEEEYQQLLAAITKPSSNEPPPPPAACPTRPDINARRMCILTAALVVCKFALPIGIAMRLPSVWGLAIAGIIVAPIKMRRIARSQEKRP